MSAKKCYTAGELAKLAGVSSRTIRFYDQKGILKPVAYSDGRYRLYDESSLLQLQKILMLKYADFSLEEIEGIIKDDKQTSLQDTLWKQKLLLLQKRERLDGVIVALNHVMEKCSEEGADWEKIVELMQLTNKEEAFGKRFDFYEKYSLRQKEWHPWVFQQLNLAEGMRVLDLGCGGGLLWLKNWKQIPAHVQITAIDKSDTGIEIFERFYLENKEFLQEGVEFQFIKGDLEQMVELPGSYDCIVANHLWSLIKQPIGLMEKAKEALEDKGCMMSTLSAVGWWEALRDIFEQGNSIEKVTVEKTTVDNSFRELAEQLMGEKKLLEAQLQSIFNSVEEKFFENILVMKEVKVCLEYLQNFRPDVVKQIPLQDKALERAVSMYLKQEGEVRIRSMTPLYRCYKN